MSRREAREAERRAAEAQARAEAHPSGIVDFDAPASGPQYAPNQEFSVGDTTDIWAALQRRADAAPAPRPVDDGVPEFRSGVPEAPRAGDSGAMSADLLDRVREAVLRRERDDDRSVPTRRELRQRETSDLREDGLPSSLFEAPAAPEVPAYPEPVGFGGVLQQDEYDPSRPDYYDEPYAPEPTAIVPVLPAPGPAHEPAGDDALTFSDPAAVVAAPLAAHPEAEPDVAFLEPRDPWAAAREQAFGAAPAPEAPAAVPAAFEDPRVGPPSEVTDLAGFEALIRKARAQQPGARQPGPQPVAAPRAAEPKKFAWADEDDAQDGFTGLIGRGVQGSNGSSNALILPSDPQPDLMQAVNSTGDIFVTGSMNLSKRLSTTGAAFHHDEAEIDRLYEAAQDEPAAGVAPVRASKAVSGTGSNRSVVTGRRRGNVVPTVLAIVASAMAVGVVSLIVFSWVSGVL